MNKKTGGSNFKNIKSPQSRFKSPFKVSFLKNILSNHFLPKKVATVKDKPKTTAPKVLGLKRQYIRVLNKVLRKPYSGKKNYDHNIDQGYKIPRPIGDFKLRRKTSEKQHYPFLSLDMDILSQRRIVQAGGMLRGVISNNGNSASYTPFIEYFEMRRAPYTDGQVPVSGDYYIRKISQMMLDRVLYPGQKVDFEMEWEASGWHFYIQTLAVAICYDPVLDPRPKAPYDWNGQRDFHRKIVVFPLHNGLA